MTIDYKTLAERIEAIARGFDARSRTAYTDRFSERHADDAADLRIVVSLLNGMADAEPRAYIECAIFGQADDDLVWKKGAVGHYIPLFTHPAPEPQHKRRTPDDVSDGLRMVPWVKEYRNRTRSMLVEAKRAWDGGLPMPPQPQPEPIDPHMIVAEDRFPDEPDPTEAQIEKEKANGSR